MQIETSAFAPGADIPRRFTCDGADTSPALRWRAAPQRTESFALVMDDPDAPRGTWVHWVLYDVPRLETGLPEGVPTVRELETGARQGTNDFGRIGYGGPCPPPGSSHRYFFRLYALSATLDLRPGASRADLDRAMRGLILAEAELIGRYRRDV